MSDLGNTTILGSDAAKEYSGVYADPVTSKGSASLVNSILSAAIASESSSSLSALLDAAGTFLQSNPTAAQERSIIETTAPTLTTTSSGVGETEASEGPYTTATGDATTDATYLYDDIELVLNNPGQSAYLTDLLSLLISMGGYEQPGAYDGTTLNTELSAVASDVEILGTALVDFDMVYTFYSTFWANMGGDNQFSTASADGEAAVQAAAQSLVDEMNAAGMNASTPYFGNMYTEASDFADGTISLSWSPASLSGGIVITGTSQYGTLSTVVDEQNAAYQGTEVNGEYNEAKAASTFINSFETTFASELTSTAAAAQIAATGSNTPVDTTTTAEIIAALEAAVGTFSSQVSPQASTNLQTAMFQLWQAFIQASDEPNSVGAWITCIELLASMGANYEAGDYSTSAVSSFLNSDNGNAATALNDLQKDLIDSLMVAVYYEAYTLTGSASEAESDTQAIATQFAATLENAGVTSTSNPFAGEMLSELETWEGDSYFTDTGAISSSTSDSYLNGLVTWLATYTTSSTSVSSYVDAIMQYLSDSTFGSSSTDEFSSLMNEVYDASSASATSGNNSFMTAWTALMTGFVGDLMNYVSQLSTIDDLISEINTIQSEFQEPQGSSVSYSITTDSSGNTVYTTSGGFCDYTITVNPVTGAATVTWTDDSAGDTAAAQFMDNVESLDNWATMTANSNSPLASMASEIETDLNAILNMTGTAYMQGSSTGGLSGTEVTFYSSESTSGSPLTLQELAADGSTPVYYYNSNTDEWVSIPANEALSASLQSNWLYGMEGVGSVPGGTSITSEIQGVSTLLETQSKIAYEGITLVASMMKMSLTSAQNTETQLAAINTQAVSNQTA